MYQPKKTRGAAPGRCLLRFPPPLVRKQSFYSANQSQRGAAETHGSRQVVSRLTDDGMAFGVYFWTPGVDNRPTRAFGFKY